MAKYDKDAVRQAAAGRWREILTSLSDVPLEILDAKHHPCPRCGGEDRFRAFDDVDETGGLICNQCHAEKNGDGFASLQWLLGLKFTDVLAKVADHVGVAPAKAKGNPADGLEWQPWSSELVKLFVSRKAGVSEQALLDAGARLARYKKQYTVVAIPVIGQDLDVDKPVGWALYNAIGDALPRWNKAGEVTGQVKVKIAYGSKPGLVGVHAIERLKTDGLPELVWKTEGLTDALALQAAIPAELRDRHLVVTNANGAGETPRWQAAVLSRTNCHIVHDADKPGQDGAKTWAVQVAAQQEPPRQTRNVELPFEISPDHGKDLRDWLATHTYADLLDLAERMPPEQVAKTDSGEIDYSQVRYPVQEKILRKLQIEVLYEDEEGRIRVFSSLLRKSSWIRQVDRLKRETLIQICGPPAKVHVSSDPDGEDTWSISDVREAIAMAACTRRGKDDERGVGIWRGLDDFGNETNTVVVVGNTEAARWNGDQVLRRVLAPRIDGLVLDFGADSQDWYDFEQLARDMQDAKREEWRRRVIDQTVALFEKWRWRSQKTNPTLVTGLVLATWVQTIWEWRPLVAVTGATNSGKSYLFNAIGGIDNRLGMFGRLAFKQAKSTEAGIRQGVGKTACALICDEFEDAKDRQAILKLLRASTRGEMIARGTAGGKHAQKFMLRHVAWVAAIEAGLDEAADNNRFIQLDLLRAEEGQHGKLVLPEPSDLVHMGRELLAVAIWSAIEAKRLAIRLKSTQAPGIEPRHVESYAVPAAILSVACGYDEGQARSLLVDLLANIERDSQARSDEEQLLDDILAAPLLLDGKVGVLSVGHVLESTTLYGEFSLRLESVGVRLVDDDKLFVVTKVAKQHLLKHTEWSRKSIDKILLRLDGAERSVRKIGGRAVRGIVVPLPADAVAGDVLL